MASSATGLEDRVFQDCLYTTVDVSTDSTTIYTGKCLLLGLYVNTVISAHTVVIKDNAAAIVTTPASLAAGTNLSFPGIRIETALVVDPDNSATGNITVFWKPI